VSSALSLSDRQNVEGYLAHKWALVGNLPAAHPHKNAAPVTAVAIATLNGTASDPENNTLTNTWTVISGPASVAFANASATGTTATFTAEGTYTLRLTSSDGFSTSFDEMVVTVGAQTNYTVAYDGNGATGGTTPVDANSPYEPGANVTVFDQGDLVKNGHTFAGWNTTANGSGTHFESDESFTASGTVTLYAQWIPNIYTVSFGTNGGSVPDPASMQVTFAATYGTLPSTSRAGFDFAGWFTAPVGGNLVTADSPIIIAADHTLSARWTAGIAAPAAAKHYIRGESENLANPLGYFQTTSSNVGTGGATGSRDDRNPVFGFTLPTLPVGGTLDAATFNFEITAAFDTTGGQNLPGLHAYLLDSADPTGTGTTFFYHGTQDPSANARRIGTTSVTISGTTSVPFPAGQEVRSFSLTGDALTLLKSYYSGNTPTRSTAYFRFNLSVDSTTVSLRRYNVNTTEAGSSLQLVYTAPTIYTITYNANGADSGSVPDSQTKSQGVDVILAENPGNLTKENHVFSGWNTAADGNGTDFAAGATYAANADLTLYADWTPKGTPTILAWPTAAGIVEGQALSAATLGGGSASVPGSFTYNDPLVIPAAGTYTAAVTFTPGDTVNYLTVSGTVDVTVLTAFEAWAGAVTFTGDANGDGVTDGMAWLLGATNPTENANALLPTASENNGALEAEFTMLNQAKRGAAVLKLQYGTDLGTWTTVTIPEVSGTHDGVVFVITPVGDLNEVKATVPATAAGTGTRLFMRLNGQ
jgi:uncharacterized repeat protein (TIGR02543 family)